MGSFIVSLGMGSLGAIREPTLLDLSDAHIFCLARTWHGDKGGLPSKPCKIYKLEQSWPTNLKIFA